MAKEHGYRLFSWEHSYFSGKVRAYLRYKQRMGGLPEGFEDILATNDLVFGLLLPATGTIAVPQLQQPDGAWIQDSSEILDTIERDHPSPRVIPDPERTPRQCLTSYLIEFLADEWMIVQGFWERWRHTLPDVEPNHAAYNALQWGSGDASTSDAATREAAGHEFFELAFGLSEARTAPRGVYEGCIALGVNDETEAAWDLSAWRILTLLNAHFGRHDFCLGGQPSLGDFGLFAPLYAHLYRDPVPGFVVRESFPQLADWVDRTNGTNALNARTYDQKLYSLGPDGELEARPATTDGGALLAEDSVPETLLPLLGVFFEEMWPVLESATRTLVDFLDSEHHQRGGELPGKSFTPSPGFEHHQQGSGALTHEFEIGGVRARRMVMPYQVWMLERLAAVLKSCLAAPGGRAAIENLLAPFPGHESFLDLSALLAECRVRKEGGRLFSVAAA